MAVNDKFNENFFDDDNKEEFSEEATQPQVEIDDSAIRVDNEKEVESDDFDEDVAKKKKGSFFKAHKKLVIILGVVILLIGILVVKAKLGKKGDNVYDITSKILTQELGSFTYVIDVRTGEIGSLNKESVKSTDLSNLENVELDPESAPKEEKKNDWEKGSGFSVDYWKYPNFKITISGNTMSTSPLETQFTVSLATEYYNDVFTDITVKDGKYYINTEKMRNWLVSSKDKHLYELGQQIPEGSTYVELTEDEFYYTSRYAEIGEYDLAKSKSIREMYINTVLATNTLINQIRNNKKVESDSKAGTSSVEFTGEDAIAVANSFKSIILNVDSMYDKYMSSVQSTWKKSDEDMQQMKREKDNVVEAYHDLQLLLSTYDMKNTKPVIKGQSRNFKNGAGNQQLEATWLIVYTLKDRDVQIGISLSKTGEKKDIAVPTGTTYKPENKYLAQSVVDACFDYFNFTHIATSKQLEITPQKIANDITDDFIQLVNESDVYSKYLTRDNLQEYLEKYANYEENDDTTNGDLINAKLVADFFNSINSVTGGVVKEVEKQHEDTTPKYTQVAKKLTVGENTVDLVANVNEEETTKNLIVIDMSLLYSKEVDSTAELDSDEIVDDSIEVDLTNFSLHTLLKSTYPANNEIILKDSHFDMSKVQAKAKLQPNIKTDVKLYVVVNGTDEYMDLWYGDVNLGEVVNH